MGPELGILDHDIESPHRVLRLHTLTPFLSFRCQVMRWQLGGATGTELVAGRHRVAVNIVTF